jgi:hypothetical protein
MTRKNWDQRKFADLRNRRNSPASYRHYEAMFYFLSGNDLKQAREWDLFVRFCEAGQFEIDPAKVEMLDPPWPDLKVELFGHTHYFELGEIVQQEWMMAQAQQEKMTIIDTPLPLTAVLSPLESIIRKKERNTSRKQHRYLCCFIGRKTFHHGQSLRIWLKRESLKFEQDSTIACLTTCGSLWQTRIVFRFRCQRK